MTAKTKTLVMRGLLAIRNDSYERALLAFRGLSPEEMQKQYGQSGQTRQQILDRYRENAEAVEAAMHEVEGL